MNNPSPRHRDHPDHAQLDRLRAGLLDTDPAAKNRLLAHLRDCAHCRERAGAMQQLVTASRAHPDAQLGRQLHARRLAALAGNSASSMHKPARRFFAPAFALAAVIAMVIGLGAFLELEPAPAPAPQDMAQAPADNVPDVYADIDFYLWLSNHPPEENADADRS